jgi:hypothetical protein
MPKQVDDDDDATIHDHGDWHRRLLPRVHEFWTGRSIYAHDIDDMLVALRCGLLVVASGLAQAIPRRDFFLTSLVRLHGPVPTAEGARRAFSRVRVLGLPRYDRIARMLHKAAAQIGDNPGSNWNVKVASGMQYEDFHDLRSQVIEEWCAALHSEKYSTPAEDSDPKARRARKSKNFALEDTDIVILSVFKATRGTALTFRMACTRYSALDGKPAAFTQDGFKTRCQRLVGEDYLAKPSGRYGKKAMITPKGIDAIEAYSPARQKSRR